MSVTSTAPRGEYRTGRYGRRYYHYHPVVVERDYMGFDILRDPNSDRYYVAGLEVTGEPTFLNPVQRIEHPDPGAARKQINTICTYLDYLAAGHTPEQWRVRQEREALEAQLRAINWKLAHPPHSGTLQDCYRGRKTEIERQLRELGVAP